MNDFIKALNNISPYIRRAWDGHMLPGWELNERVIFDYEIVYIMEGNGIVTIEDRTYNAGPGELYFFRPAVRHSMKTAGNSILRQPHIHFDLFHQDDSEDLKICYRSMDKIKPEELKLFRNDTGKINLFQIPEKIKLKDRIKVETVFFKIICEQESPDSFSRLRSKAYFIELLVYILSEVYEISKTSDSVSPFIYETVNVVSEYIRLNYRSKISLEQLSHLAGISKSYLLYLFNRIYNISPLQYQTKIRIERAKQMIEASHNTISKISEYLGFLDVQHFSKVFKKKTGMSPSNYKAKAGRRL